MPRTAAAAPRHAAPKRPARVPSHASEPAPSRPVARPLPRGAAVLDATLHGRAWIGLVFVLLAGIVFFNVDLLQMNREIAQTEERVGSLKRENARLRTDLARLASSERIQRVAAERGLVLPAPGEVRYLRSDPAVDARRAAARIEADEVSPPAPEAVPRTQQAGVQPPE
ncbi:MAG: cell division protein FtsL [Actinomycetota bacterium]|nr:cell division protein FtsL [Actinomycetota bacterium]